MDILRLTLLILGIALIAGIYLWETRRRRHRSHEEFDDLDTTYLDELGDDRNRKDYGYAWDPESSEPDDQPQDTDDRLQELDYKGLGDDHFVDEPYNDLADKKLAEETTVELFGPVEQTLEGLEFIVPGVTESVPADAEVTVEGDGFLVALTVMAAPKERFAGVTLAEVMEAFGFSYGSMQIYHRYPDKGSTGSAPMFSVANVLKPGTFDLDAIEEFSTQGIVLFMEVSGGPGSVEAFDTMVETGERLAEHLDGELRDESRSTLTTQVVNHLREEIVEYGRQCRLKASE